MGGSREPLSYSARAQRSASIRYPNLVSGVMRGGVVAYGRAGCGQADATTRNLRLTKVTKDERVIHSFIIFISCEFSGSSFNHLQSICGHPPFVIWIRWRRRMLKSAYESLVAERSFRRQTVFLLSPLSPRNNIPFQLGCWEMQHNPYGMSEEGVSELSEPRQTRRARLNMVFFR